MPHSRGYKLESGENEAKSPSIKRSDTPYDCLSNRRILRGDVRAVTYIM